MLWTWMFESWRKLLSKPTVAYSRKDFGVHHESSEGSEHRQTVLDKQQWPGGCLLPLRMNLSASRAVLSGDWQPQNEHPWHRAEKPTKGEILPKRRLEKLVMEVSKRVAGTEFQREYWKPQSRTQQGNGLPEKLRRGVKWDRTDTERVERCKVLKYLPCSDGLDSGSAQDCWPQELQQYLPLWKGPQFDQHLPGAGVSWQPQQEQGSGSIRELRTAGNWLPTGACGAAAAAAWDRQPHKVRLWPVQHSGGNNFEMCYPLVSLDTRWEAHIQIVAYFQFWNPNNIYSYFLIQCCFST